MKKRTCRTCKVEKTEGGFPKRASEKDGLDTQCKVCWRHYNSKEEKTARRTCADEKRDLLKLGRKLCKKCNVVKLITFFPKLLGNKDGLGARCKECEKKKR